MSEYHSFPVALNTFMLSVIILSVIAPTQHYWYKTQYFLPSLQGECRGAY